MMLWSPELAVVPVTIHLPLRDVPAQLTTELDRRDRRASWRAISRARFGIARPRLAVAGLNPHAGEDGALGDEDAAIIAPGGRSACRPTASTPAGRCRPTRCSMRGRARPTTSRSACITTRR